VLPDTVEVEELPRLRGRRKHGLDYRHIIDWLVRKPGAFEHYCYREDLFPTSWSVSVTKNGRISSEEVHEM
jgi:hypothetical protein